jgi:hypothetical protein
MSSRTHALIIVAVLGCGGSKPAAEEPKAREAELGGELTCRLFVEHLVEVAASGSEKAKSMSPEDIKAFTDKSVGECEARVKGKAPTDAEKQQAACAMKATTQPDVDACLAATAG